MSPVRSSFAARLARFVGGATLAAGALAFAAGPASTSVAPFHRLRDTTLGYNGASDDIPDLKEIRIGWFGPSDPDDPINGEIWWAAEFAVREANAARGQGKGDSRDAAEPASPRSATLPIRLVRCWAPDPWRAGVSLLARMVYDEQPLAVLGSIDSASTHLAEQVVAKANLPLVSPVASDKTATLAGVSWMFACAPDDAAIARALVRDLRRATRSTGSGRPTIHLIATTDHPSRMIAREVTAEISRCELPLTFRFDVAPGSAITDEALQTGAERPTVVIILADVVDTATLTRAIRARFGAVPIFGGPVMGRTRFVELAGPAAEGVRFPVLFTRGAPDDVRGHFNAQFLAERHHAPDYAAALAYDATRLLIAAIERAGPNRARIREALHQLSPWSGVAGPIAFDGTGQNERSELDMGAICAGSVVVESVSAALPAKLSSP